MKKLLLRVKWENIISLLFGILFIISIIKHISENGLFEMLGTEIALYGLMLYALWYSIRTTRKENK